jgi:hypothetical protein
MTDVSTTAACPVCSSSLKKSFDTVILGRHRIGYFHCESCGLLKTEKPYWLEEAYSEAIASADTGLVSRNVDIAHKLIPLFYFAFDRRARYLDTAGGTGLLTRLMRDAGFDFYWRDPYCENVHARGFEFSSATAPCEVVTAFEVLEHLEDPIGFVSEALRESGADTFIFTTETYNGRPPEPGSWWYYTPETGQHISFYQLRTLERIAEKLGLRFYTYSGLHILTRRKLSPLMCRISLGRLGRMLVPVLKRRLMQSKTMSDHVAMLKLSQTREPAPEQGVR